MDQVKRGGAGDGVKPEPCPSSPWLSDRGQLPLGLWALPAQFTSPAFMYQVLTVCKAPGPEVV